MTRVVALHGFLGRPEDWSEVRSALRALAPHVDFEAIHLPFRSEPGLPGTTAAWAAEFNRGRQRRGGENDILIGYSLGGRLALQAALDQPGLWNRVILISSHPGITDAREAAQRLRTDAAWADRFNRLAWADLMQAWNSQPVFADSHEPERREGDYDRAALAHVVLNWSPARNPVARDALTGLGSRLRWYAGARDTKYIRLFEGLRTAGLVAELQVIAEAGHRIIFDRPLDLARRLVLDRGP